MTGFEKIKTDILVVGGGIAGAFAALRARESGLKVAIADKAVFGRSGCSAVASGIYASYMPGDNLDLWLKDCIEELVSPYMYDQELSAKAIKDTYQLLQQMDEWGVKFVKKNGEIARLKSSGGELARNVMLEESGPQMMKALSVQAKRSGISIINRVMITDLLTSDGKLPTAGTIAGAIGFHTQSGKIIILQSKAVILCAGPFSMAESMPQNIYGDGIAMANRAGAELCGLDKHGIVIVPEGMKSAPGIVVLFGMGAKLYNSLNERFMEKYAPLLLEKAVRNVVGLSAAREVREGRGPISMDMTHFTPEQFVRINSVIPIVMENFRAGGYDPSKDRIPYVPETRMTTVSGGGVSINADGASSIEGLFAAGDSSDYARATTGSPLSSSAVTGSWAGTGAAKYAAGSAEKSIDEKQIKELAEKINSPLNRKEITLGDIHNETSVIRDHDIGIFMHGERLRTGLRKIEDINRSAAGKLKAENTHELAKVHGVINMCQGLELMIKASLHRKESRGSFVREDYPETDNVNWLKWLKIRGSNQSITIDEEPIPIDSYPLKPEKKKTLHHIFKGWKGIDGN